MIKKINYLILLFTFILIIGCSFDNQTGIWSGEELEQKWISELEQQTEKAINVVKNKEKYINLFNCDKFIIADFLLDNFTWWRYIYFIK